MLDVFLEMNKPQFGIMKGILTDYALTSHFLDILLSSLDFFKRLKVKTKNVKEGLLLLVDCK